MHTCDVHVAQYTYLYDTVGTDALCNISGDELSPCCKWPHPAILHIVPRGHEKYTYILMTMFQIRNEILKYTYWRVMATWGQTN